MIKVEYNKDSQLSLILTYCAYCGKFLGSKDGKGVSGISHGACPACLVKELAKIKNRRPK